MDGGLRQWSLGAGHPAGLLLMVMVLVHGATPQRVIARTSGTIHLR